MPHILIALIGLALATVAVSWLRANWQATDDFDAWCKHYASEARRRNKEFDALVDAFDRARNKHQ